MANRSCLVLVLTLFGGTMWFSGCTTPEPDYDVYVHGLNLTGEAIRIGILARVTSADGESGVELDAVDAVVMPGKQEVLGLLRCKAPWGHLPNEVYTRWVSGSTSEWWAGGHSKVWAWPDTLPCPERRRATDPFLRVEVQPDGSMRLVVVT